MQFDIDMKQTCSLEHKEGLKTICPNISVWIDPSQILRKHTYLISFNKKSKLLENNFWHTRSQEWRQMLRIKYRNENTSSALKRSMSSDTSPTWKTYVLNIISRMMIMLKRMAMSWILQRFSLKWLVSWYHNVNLPWGEVIMTILAKMISEGITIIICGLSSLCF